jgi:hypothetical protein
VGQIAVHRPFVALLLAPLLGSCQPPDILVRAGFIDNALVFVAEDPGDSDSIHCWNEGIVVDDKLQPVWQFGGAHGDCRKLFPLYYGQAPEGAGTETPAGRLEPGRLYLFIGNAVAATYGSFALTQVGNVTIVHNVDPDSPVAQALRERWWQKGSDVKDGSPTPAELASAP